MEEQENGGVTGSHVPLRATARQDTQAGGVQRIFSFNYRDMAAHFKTSELNVRCMYIPI